MKDIFRYPAIAFLFALCLSSFPANAIGRGSSTYIKSASYIQLSEAVLQPSAEFSEESISAGDETLKLALKTNTLALAGLVPNVGAELYLGKNWSLSANWNYAWWNSDKHLWYWRTYGGELAVRKWFGRQSRENTMAGHHVGLYGQMMTYDFLLGKNGILADKWNYAGGLEYGYSFPLNDCLRLDLAAGFGFMGGEYKNYKPMDGHYVWQSTMKRRYYGPTKAELSLVWIIDFNGRK